jgi:CDGSH-type Zn-finger protein
MAMTSATSEMTSDAEGRLIFMEASSRRVVVVDNTEVVIKVRDNGPYKVTGPVTVVDAEGNRFDLPDGPVALCRCGRSLTKPFCDASHKGSGFDACERA